jgi:hypothetical protein
MNSIDDHRIERTDEELEEFWLFSICVAGKEATLQERRLREFLDAIPTLGSPFRKITSVVADGTLTARLRSCKLGKYERTAKAFEQSLGLNLRTCTIEDLEDVFGVGPKTARFFVLHTRAGSNVAVLDTHILKRLKESYPDAPTTTPQNRREYRKWERIALDLADKEGQSPFQFDEINWKRFAISTRTQGKGT